jgi:beta-lactamase regulating signal transducer with metallopeptidase domain
MNWLSAVFTADPGSFILHSIKVSVMLASAPGVLYILRRTSASIRSFILCLALVGVAVLPLSSLFAPQWAVVSMPTASLLDSGRPSTSDRLQPSSSPAQSASMASLSLVDPKPTSRPFPWRPIVTIMYLLGAAACVVRLAVALVRVSRLRRSGMSPTDPDGQIVSMAATVSRRIGLRGIAVVRLSKDITIPMTCGWFHPIILLPAGATQWPVDKLEAVLLHEAAHIKRRDNLSSLLAQLAIIWQWFNPLPWWVLKRYHLEREKACDDLVLSGGIGDIDYARHLVDIGRSAASAGQFALAGLVHEGKRDFEGRLMDILDTRKRRTPVTTGSMTVIIMLAVFLMAPLAGLAGKPPAIAAPGVTPEQQEELVTALSGLYGALSRGDDFQSICDRFLSKNYFDRPELTMENLDRSEWDAVRKRMTAAAYNEKLSLYPRVAVLVTAIRPEDGKFVLTEKLNLVAEGVGGQPVPVVKDYEHHIEMVKENGAWKVARYDDGVSLMRMDVDNPYGPIFLLWVHEQNPTTTPLGPWIAKVLPATVRTENMPFLKFVVEE